MKTMQSLFCALFILAGLGQAKAQSPYFKQLADSAYTLTKDRVVYDPTYYSIDYPMGDVPDGKGVCTDVVIRAYRKLGTDLQALVHRDMKRHFSSYPKNWGLKRPDPNIDHRRVPNLMTYFKRQGASLRVTQKGEDYLPGDVVSWNLGGGITHIGVVSDVPSRTHPNRFQMIHNIGEGQVVEDCLFSYQITGHFRYRPR